MLVCIEDILPASLKKPFMAKFCQGILVSKIQAQCVDESFAAAPSVEIHKQDFLQLVDCVHCAPHSQHPCEIKLLVIKIVVIWLIQMHAHVGFHWHSMTICSPPGEQR